MLKLSKTLIFNMVYLGFPAKEKGRGTNILQASVYEMQMRTKKVLILF